MKDRWLYGLIIFGIALRLISFGRIPVALNRDEAALGYNAYAVATAGIDEWGIAYPLLFKSFGDYKLPGYIYALVPLVKIFGLSEWVVRLPSLLAGLTLIYLSYLTVRKTGSSRSVALFSAALVAVSPWTIFYSRVAFEANLGLALFVAACLMFSSPKLKSILLGLILFALSILTYNTPLLLTPLLLGILVYNKIPLRLKLIALTGVVLVAGSWLYLTAQVTSQKGQITIFQNTHTAFQQQSAYLSAANPLQKVLASKYFFYPAKVAKNLLTWLSPQFLVTSGGENPWHSLPGRGHLYYVVYLLFIVQCLRSIRTHNLKSIILNLFIFAIAILPSLVTVDSPHATRSLLGLWLVLLFAARMWHFKTVRLFVFLALTAEILIFSHAYFIRFPAGHSPEWQAGLREAILSSINQYPTEPLAIINPYDQPYIYTLFYTQADPHQFLNTVERYGVDSAGQEKIKAFGRWLFIGDPKDVPSGIPILYRDQNQNYHLIDVNGKL